MGVGRKIGANLMGISPTNETKDEVTVTPKGKNPPQFLKPENLMANGGVTKGSPVEVSSDEPGFQGAWYVATFLARVQTKKRVANRHLTKLGYLVKYHTLFKDDQFLEPLTEVVNPSFVRPLPPPNILPNNGANAKEAQVALDAARDGFELYDVIDAYHRDGWWVGVVKNLITECGIRKYIVSFEDPPEEFEFEGSKLRLHVDWVDCRWLVPPKKQSGERRNASDDAINSRSLKRSKSNCALDASVTYSRNKRSANSRGKRFQSSAGIGNKGNTKVIMSVLETSGCVDVHQDSPPVENRIIVTQTCVSEDGKSHEKRKRGRPPKLVVRKPVGIIEDGHSVSTDIDEQPLSVWYQGMHPRSILKKSSCLSPYHLDNSVNQVLVTSVGTTTDYQKDWPFIKRSPIWATIESLELYLTPPQKPHFSPLKTMKEDYREGFAIAYMVTFGNLVQRLSYLQLNDPVDIISNSLETLSELETHGFDVGSFQGRLKELLSLKSKSFQHEDKLKEVEKELEKCNHEKSLVEKEMDQLNVKMLELQEKMVHTVTMQKAKEEEIMRLQSSLRLVSSQVMDWELAFNELAATPL